jgi:hypothetical protein
MKTLLALIILLLLLFVSESQATTRYVANSCSGQPTPCHTSISAALSAAATNDTILIRNGTYTETISHTQGPTGPLTIAAYPGNCVTSGVIGPGVSCETVTLNGNAGAGAALVESKASYTFDGLTLDAHNAQYGVQTWGNNAILKNMDIHDATNAGAGSFPFAGMGVEITENVSGTQILNTKIHDNGLHMDTNGDGRAGHGVYYQGSNGIIDGSEIYNNGHEGIQLYCNVGGSDCPSGTSNSNNIIKNSRIHDNGQLVADCGITAFSNLPGAKPHIIYNNLIYNNKGNGLCLDNQAGSGQISYSNTIYNNGLSNGGFGISLGHGSGHIVKNNIVWSNPTDLYDFGVGGSVTASNNLCASVSGSWGSPCNITSNPNFVNPAGNDFQLNSTSPAIDHGAALGSPYNVDFAGVSRPQPPGGSWDIGAYEFGGALVVTITGSSTSCTLSNCIVSGPATGGSIVFSGTTTATSAGAVTFSTDRGSSGNAAWSPGSGWTTDPVPLKSGTNHVTITSTDASSNMGSASIVVTYEPTFPGNSLVAAYGFEEADGVAPVDSTPNCKPCNTGTLVGSPTHATGKYGTGLQLNGTTQYVTVNDSNSLDFTQSFTISAWVNSAVAAASVFKIIVAKNSSANSGGPQHPYELFSSVQGYCGDGGVSGFVTINGNGLDTNTSNACNSSPLQPNTWTHLAITYDGVNGGGLKLYEQGVLVQTTAVSGYMEPSSNNLMLGNSEFGAELFFGILDEIRIYNYAIPVSTAAENVTPGAACFLSSGVQTNIARPSIIGDMNCQIIPPTIPPTGVVISWGADKNPVFGADKTVIFGQ